MSIRSIDSDSYPDRALCLVLTPVKSLRQVIDIYPGFSLVELLHYCALIGRELQSVEIFSE